jgi:hypothetical protein
MDNPKGNTNTIEDKKNIINNIQIDNNNTKDSNKTLSNKNLVKSINFLQTIKNENPELEKYVKKLKNIDYKDNDFQEGLSKSYNILKKNSVFLNQFEKSKEFLDNFSKNSQNNQYDENIDYNENLEIFNILNTNLIEKTNDINEILTSFSKDNIKKSFEKNYFSEIEKLNSIINSKITNLENIVTSHNELEYNYKKIIENISSIEDKVDSTLNFNSDFFSNNKNYLIRNEILKTFLENIIITKEEKENLFEKNLFDENFIKLIKKISGIKTNLNIMEKNSEKFSKNLIFSIKENFNLVDELLNEKIVLFLKDILRNSDKFFNDKDLFNNKNMKNYYKNLKEDFSKEFNINNWILALSYLSDKSSYKNFIMKEYVNSRKKIIENIMRQKYLKFQKLEIIFENLINDSKILFIKEYILFQVFFSNDLIDNSNSNLTINKNEDNFNINELTNINNYQKQILFDLYFNNFYFYLKEDEIINEEINIMINSKKNQKCNFYLKFPEINNFLFKLKQDFNFLRKNLKSKFVDVNFSLNYLNQILYILEEILYDNLNLSKNSKNYENDLNENYKILLLSEYFKKNINDFFKEEDFIHFSFEQKNKQSSINFFILINNYKKAFANNSVKLFGSHYKFLQKLNQSAYGILSDCDLSNFSENENSLIKSYYNYIEEYYKLFNDYRNYIKYILISGEIDTKENEFFYINLNPKNQNSFKLLIEFFNNESFLRDKNKNILIIILNLLNNFYIKFKLFEDNINDDLNKIQIQINHFKNILIDFYFYEILKLANYDEEIVSIISHEQAINLIQTILDKSKKKKIIYFNLYLNKFDYK